MRTHVLLAFALCLLFGVSCFSQTGQTAPPQRMPYPLPGSMPPGAGSGIPWPEGLGRKEAITGHIGAIDVDQMMVKSPDYGEVLFWTDDKTVVRVEKFRLSIKDLRVGDAVAVRLKKIKDRGPYATEILPDPLVKERKLSVGKQPAAPAARAAESTDSAIIPAADAAVPAAAAAPVAERPAAPPAPAEPAFPALPAGVTGIVGTVTSASGDSLEVRDQQNQTQKVMLTGVTLVKIAGSQTTLPAVKAGQRVAITGDKMDTGEWVAREVLVAVSEEEKAPAIGAAAGTAAPAGSGARPPATAGATGGPPLGRDGMARFSGLITVLDPQGEVTVKTASGEWKVLVTPITEVRRMNMRRDFGALKQGDQVDVVGDVLEGGTVSAREVTVTKLAGS